MHRLNRLARVCFLLLTGLLPSARLSGADALVAREFAPRGMVGSVVGISVDHLGRVYVTQTNRRNNGELDIRLYPEWIAASLSFQSVEEKRAFIMENFKKGAVGDANQDGTVDWRDLTVPSELILRLEDTDQDGHADVKRVFADGFNEVETGLGAGVFANGLEVYFTVFPSLWKLTDDDDDGQAEGREELVRGFGIHIGYGGHDSHGPTIGPDGMIYWSMGDKGFNVKSREGAQFHFPGHGAVFRCHPDGSGFEVFAHGLRNPQEIAFDEFGNLFTVDNDGDFGDRERFVFITEGSDSGWRSQYQYRSDLKHGDLAGYNPWMAEGLWKPRFEGQPAHITPAIDNYSQGPCGFAYNPGTALNEQYRGYFFLSEFPGKNIRAFRVEPRGAGFRMVDEQIVHSGKMITGLGFGPDGALYLADWGNNAWAPHQNGSVWVLDSPAADSDRLRQETAQLLAAGFRDKPIAELSGWLAHADQRVRLGAQFELVKRSDPGRAALVQATGSDQPRLKRIHGIWGLTQLGRSDLSHAAPLRSLITDDDAEIRAQAAKALGEVRALAAAADVATLLEDSSPRVRFQAGIALGKIGSAQQFQDVVDAVEEDEDADGFLRHAYVMGLVGASRGGPERLGGLAGNDFPAVRIAGVLALRRLRDPSVARFLYDSDPAVVAEAARAINDDGSIAAAIPALAAILERPNLADEAVVRRAINANFRLGDRAAADRLAAYAALADRPEGMRVEALNALKAWTAPPPLDRVDGWAVKLPPGSADDVHAALDGHLAGLFADGSGPVQSAATALIVGVRYGNATEKMTRTALDEKADPGLRAAALEAMHALDAPSLLQALGLAHASEHSVLRIAGLSVQAGLEPATAATLRLLEKALASSSTAERQNALRLLRLSKDTSTLPLLNAQLSQLVSGEAPPEVQLDILNAVRAHTNDLQTASTSLARYQAAKEGGDRLAAYSETLHGGDPRRGRELFMGNNLAECIRCHRVGGVGGEIGPDLSQVSGRLEPRELLESLLLPQAQIAEGYGLMSVMLKSGQSVSGFLSKETPDQILIKEPDGTEVPIAKAAIDSREVAISTMPTMGDRLTPGEIRDLVAYLKTLNDPPQLNWKRFTVEGHSAFVLLPSKTGAAPVPWVLYAPTFGSSLPNQRDEGWMFQRWLQAGIALAGIDVGESYGNPEGRALYSRFFEVVTREFALAPQASLLARSRGGLMLYCWAVENPERVVSIAGIYPVCDIASYPGVSRAAAAYGMTEDELSRNLHLHNPIARLESLAEAKVPIFHLHGDIDRVVPLEKNSGALAECYLKLGGAIELNVLSGQGHNMWPGFFQSRELVDFVIRHATGQESP